MRRQREHIEKSNVLAVKNSLKVICVSDVHLVTIEMKYAIFVLGVFAISAIVSARPNDLKNVYVEDNVSTRILFFFRFRNYARSFPVSVI